MNDLEQAIISTLCYADVFNYPLTTVEVHKYLIHSSLTEATSITTAIHKLAKNRTVAGNGEYFHLRKRDELVSLRKARKKIAQKKKQKALYIAKKIARIPSVQGVFLTGALAMENSDQDDDIDVMIITKANTLWTSRLLITGLLHLEGVRRRPGKLKDPNTFCTNLFLDESALAIPPAKHNLYTAHEVAQVKPLISKNFLYERFLSANSWVTTYLPNTLIPKTKLTRGASKGNPPPTTRTSPLESLAYKLQLNHMKKRITREVVTPHVAFFHPRDTKNIVLKEYELRLKKHITENTAT